MIRQSFYLLILLGTLGSCMDPNVPLSLREIKLEAVTHYPNIVDTMGIGALKLSESPESHWWITYNKLPDSPRIYLFHSENPREPAHPIILSNRPICAITRLNFDDITYDGQYELMLELSYDHYESYQGREVVIFRYPFDSLNHTEVFSYPLEQRWRHIDSFDAKFGNPKVTERVENDATLEYFDGRIRLKGTLDNRMHHLIEYVWLPNQEIFQKQIDRELELAQAIREDTSRQLPDGFRQLVEVQSLQFGCRAFIIEDENRNAIALPPSVKSSLECAETASLSPDERYLIYTNSNKQTVNLYDLRDGRSHILHRYLNTLEGVSEVTWSNSKYQLGALVLVNVDEFETDSKLFILSLPKNGKASWNSYDLPIHFECDPKGRCTPEADFDFFFTKKEIMYRERGSSVEQSRFKRFNY